MFYDNVIYLNIYAVAEYAYCKRASFYSYIGSEEGNDENIYTQGGREVHALVDLKGVRYREEFKELKNVSIVSHALRIKGKADLVRVYKDFAVPVEYKSGIKQLSEFHKLQLTLQAICLEEQLQMPVHEAFVYFYKHNVTQKYTISERDKLDVVKLLSEFRGKISKSNIKLFEKNIKKNCVHCSFYDICMPYL